VHAIDYGELSSGGVPRDAIPALDAPIAQPAAEAEGWLEDAEPVIAVQVGGAARAYPLRLLTWHEIANDSLDSVPVAVTYCPLCNAAVAYDRRIRGGEVRLGVSGLLRYSDLVMFDRQTESLWQQLTGEAIAGEMTGLRLEPVPSLLISWADFKAAFPQGDVMSRETGYERDYGANPYPAYDSSPRPFLFTGEPDARLPALQRVLAIEAGGTAAAIPFDRLARDKVVHATVGGVPVVGWWTPGQTSALDADRIAAGRDVGSAAAFDRRASRITLPPGAPRLDGTLDFRPLDPPAGGAAFRDRGTGSGWNLAGQAVDGPLAGAQLGSVRHGSHLWFAWAALRPGTEVLSPAP
jgi:hypothetical protein